MCPQGTLYVHQARDLFIHFSQVNFLPLLSKPFFRAWVGKNVNRYSVYIHTIPYHTIHTHRHTLHYITLHLHLRLRLRLHLHLHYIHIYILHTYIYIYIIYIWPMAKTKLNGNLWPFKSHQIIGLLHLRDGTLQRKTAKEGHVSLLKRPRHMNKL